MSLPLQIVEQFPGPEHARWGLGTRILDIPVQGLRKIAGSSPKGTLPGGPSSDLSLLEHPIYQSNINNWCKWRKVYDAGHEFVDQFTQRFSNRENEQEYRKRKEVTPIPAFATGAIDEIKNSIFQRLTDVSRQGGSSSYQNSIAGRNGGVDLRGGSMNWFIGHHILPELLVFGKIGVFVDSPSYGATLKGSSVNKHPYFYPYTVENIKNWNYTTSSGESEFAAILLRDHTYTIDPETNLPLECVESYRLLYIGQDNYVHVKLYTKDNGPTETVLNITKIPFVQFEITQSLMKNVANSQIALLNMESSDISFTLRSNFPFYIEQHDGRNSTEYLKSAQVAYAINSTNGNSGSDAVTTFPTAPNSTHDNANLGTAQGRKYAVGMDAPSFIHPSPEPLLASMSKQKDVKEDIRKLVHLALSTVQSKAVSAESKAADQQGLEAGLSYIGLELENGERKLAEIWELYLNPKNPATPATIIYPERWSLKSTKEIQEEVEQLKKLRDDIPSATFKKQINKRIAQLSLGSHTSNDVFAQINKELDSAKGASSDPKTISSDVELGILGQDTACSLRGYPPEEVNAATDDHAARLARISLAQTSGKSLSSVAESRAVAQDKSLPDSSNPAARGLTDLSGQPAQDARQEKINKPKRGSANS